MKPKGTLIIIGGAEDKGDEDRPDMAIKNSGFKNFEILEQIVIDGGQKKTIEVVTTGTEHPEETKRTYKKAFTKIGFTKVSFLNVENRKQAMDADCIERIKKAEGVFFSGGDQFRISTILGGTPFIETVKEKYTKDKHFVVAGTSAGAMVLSALMIYEGGNNEALLKGDVKVTSGLGIFDTCIIDTHFISRGRFSRLSQAIITNPVCLGVGLGEDTAFVIRNGTKAECIGSGTIIVIDGRHISSTNITEVEDNEPIFVETLVVHMLCNGCKFELGERRLLSSMGKKQKGRTAKSSNK